MNRNEIVKMIDHTLLAATATKKEVEKLCREAAQFGFVSVCVNPIWVKFCAEKLAGTGVKVCTVIGFPLGAEKTEVKAFASSTAVLDGADEVDMVINIGAALENDFEAVQEDIAQVVRAAKSAGESNNKNVLVKVILETCYIADEQIVGVCLAAKEAGADFVKTSTGFATPKGNDGSPLANGASVHHVQLMKETVGDSMGVKASGSIRTAAFARELIEAGATRLGTSSGVFIANSL